MNTRPIELRNYQKAAVDSILLGLETQRYVCAELGISSGKSFVVAELLRRLEGQRIAIVVEDTLLAKQLYNFLKNEIDKQIEIFDSTATESRNAVLNCIFVLRDMVSNGQNLSLSYDQFIFVDINAKNLSPFLQNFDKRESGNLILIANTLSKADWNLFGKPLFSYDLGQAISDGHSLPLKFISGPKIHVNGQLNQKRISIALSLFKDKALRKKELSTLFICKNLDEAGLVFEVFQKEFSFLKPIMIHSKVTNATKLWRDFLENDNFNVAIVVVNQLKGIELSKLTDLVLLKRYSNSYSFIQTIARLDKSSGRSETLSIWDFGDNLKYFKSEFGSVEHDDRMLPDIVRKTESNTNPKSEANTKPNSESNTNPNSEANTKPKSESNTNPNSEANTKPKTEANTNPKSEANTKPEPEPDTDTKSQTNTVRETETEAESASIAEKVKRLLANPSDDKPTNEDLLGREGLVSILKGIIDRDARKHLIIALFGRWGSGKSSVVNLLACKYLDSHNNSFIVFNAWQEEHSSNMAAALANRIINQLYESKGLFQQLVLSLKSRLLRAKGQLFLEFLISFGIVLAAVVVLLPKIIEQVAIGTPLSISISFLVSLLVPVLKSYWSHPFTKKIREVSKKPDFDSHLGLGHQIREQLSKLLKVYPVGFWKCLLSTQSRPLRELHKYILVVDDLDRCSDAKIVESLEAIQLIVDIDGICVIIAVDHQMLIEAVASRYQKQRSNLSHENALSLARNFLGKILQITISLDRPTRERRNLFIQSRLYAGIDIEKDPANSEISSVLEVSKKNDDDEETASPFDVADFNDDEEEEYDSSDEYLMDSRTEFDFFALCATIFDFHNPRTLIRIHNAITLLKGLYPSIADDSAQLKQYMYMVFWFELFSISTKNMRDEMSTNLFLDDGNQPQQPIWDFFKKINEITLETKELRRILFRVKNLTLPSGAEFANMKENLD
jgi:flagellar biosynthesis GTPase FlhF